MVEWVKDWKADETLAHLEKTGLQGRKKRENECKDIPPDRMEKALKEKLVRFVFNQFTVIPHVGQRECEEDIFPIGTYESD